MDSDNAIRLRRQLLDRLENLSAAGVTHLGKLPPPSRVAPLPTPHSVPAHRDTPHSPPAPPALDAPHADRPEPRAPRSELPPPNSAPTPPLALDPRPSALGTPAVALDILRLEVSGCTRCSHLAAARTQTVFGVGNPQPRLCFMGEAPGADEDRQGEPFVGKAGQLLTKIIEACRMKREDVYILNVLKCRPPENRPPLEDEVANCRGYFERQLEILQPEFICCLGATAAQALLGSTLSIGKLRGRFHNYQGATVICTYHPSYLLRNPAAKRDVWEDMKTLMRKMGVELET